MQLFQALLSIIMVILNLFGPLLRFLGLVIQSIPGSKSVLKFIPFISGEPKKKKICSSTHWPNGKKIYTRHDLMRDYLNDPEVIERMKLERMPPNAKLAYFNNKHLTTIQYSQPKNVTMTVKFSGRK
ncbi:TMhelix containing protein [Vibrio phage 2.275.O._10N.286.54.E11]|nr:TMhelix containing protein [Vibrio phage 2.275.O._10N.286.54.E11]